MAALVRLVAAPAPALAPAPAPALAPAPAPAPAPALAPAVIAPAQKHLDYKYTAVII